LQKLCETQLDTPFFSAQFDFSALKQDEGLRLRNREGGSSACHKDNSEEE
jgi:hypothetical protein